MTRFQFGKFGMVEDPRGAHVAWSVGDKHYLGTVIDVYQREFPQATMLKVNHFCGDPTPDVAASAVEVLVRVSAPEGMAE